MTDIVRLVTNARRGRAVMHNRVLYVGGQAASDRTQGIEGQTAEALTKLEKVLLEAGTDMDHLLTAQIWLKDISRDFVGFNEVWDTRIGFHVAPARATAQCEMGAPDVLVEIIVTAAMPV
ncbi:RidA family protein [Sphingomonas sp. LB2R24]|uniref:RidA family protein n=1 Tax=Sphingomonas sorbitolis TaxID=3096165 RepID=UPI002FC77AA5